MRWQPENVNPMLVLRNAVRNRRWSETWRPARAHQRGLRTRQRQADSHQRLTRALWTLVFWGVRLSRLSHPPVHAATSLTTPANTQQTARSPDSGYSWRKPFLRRPPSIPVGSREAGAKK